MEKENPDYGNPKRKVWRKPCFYSPTITFMLSDLKLIFIRRYEDEDDELGDFIVYFWQDKNKF